MKKNIGTQQLYRVSQKKSVISGDSCKIVEYTKKKGTREFKQLSLKN